MEETKIPFRPVRCFESDLNTMIPVDGHVIFTIDTRKLFMVIDGEFRMMGGNSGIYYGTKILTEEEKLDKEQILFSFLHSEIDGDELPAEDDLILNIPDGGFYRVLEVNDIDIQTQRIAISGGGTGGGSGSGDITNKGSLVINYVPETPKKSSTITGVDYYIEFEIIAKDSAGDLISEEGSATWLINGKKYYQKVKNGRNSFKVDEYLDPSLDGDGNKIYLTVTMNTGSDIDDIQTKVWYVKAVDLALKWDWKYTDGDKLYINKDTYDLGFIPYGGVDCVAHLIFDDSKVPNETYFTKEIKASNTGDTVYFNGLPRLDYGSHTAEMYLTAEVNGITYQTKPSIFNEITFIGNGSKTILTVPYYNTTASQYDTLNIPFLVYDPDQESCEVVFLVNDIEVGRDTYDRTLHNWPYTLTEYGSVKLTIQTANNEDSVSFDLVVNELDLDVEEVPNADFSLKANNFSSNNEIRNFNYKGITLSFSDGVNDDFKPFDWDKGGLQTEILADGSIRKYICVRQGTRMTINYNLFQNFTSGRNGGKDFKICFKASNCYDYSAPILECYEEQTQVGVKLDAQKALFSTSTFPGFETKYYENQYIELETEIWPNIPDENENYPADRFLMFWVDGVPAGVKAYPTSEMFTHRVAKPIVIGSDLCDVYIYVVKVYERRLTENEHLDNFIMDAPSTTEMLARYHRNNIVDNTGEISYEKLVQNNPKCHAYVYEVPKMTTSKDDKVKGCDYFELFEDYNTIDKPYYKANNTGDGVRIRVQGTSSAAYGVAAFNMRTEFQEGLVDKDGKQVDAWEINNTAIPIDYVCTKVNVASSENANNVVNQEWYNKYQPYHDAHRRKTRSDGRLYRDTMEFNSGVIFIKDNNPETNYLNDEGKPDRAGYLNANMFLDTRGYTNKPYYKMYAIGNMGNDKKNSEVFHDITNPKALCVEVADNQNAEHWMTKTIDMTQFDLEKPYHEFRYPDGNDKATIEQKQAWIDFVDWMAHSDPSPYDEKDHPYGYTGEELPSPITYEAYTFRGFDPPGYEGKINPTGISLKGSTVSTYAGTYTHDTYEYRMAKMLNECEDHLVMDSIVFHYLFIQRHTMVDNVAKNTFWSTEDLIHWDLTKDYDNDTSDGNDNSGYLTFDYGLEILDKTAAGGEIYNAAPSVWLHFIHGLPEVQKTLYKLLENKGAWRADLYLAEFDKHQNPIPERCWIYDYFRKYIRPRRLGLDSDTYLNRLEGGKKTHQRRQFETYQEFYMNSKYIAGTPFTDGASIDMRLNSDPKTGIWNPENELPASFYVDCYASCHFGGQIRQSGRLKRGQRWGFPVGAMVSNPSDSTAYIYGANMIQTLEGLSEVYPTYANVSSATKLREIDYGSDAEDYSNEKLSSIGIGSNAMLQNVYAQNVGSPDGIGSLDLKQATQLKELKLDGSTLKALTLADGSSVELLYLNDLSTLTMSNLQRLNDIQLDENIYNTMSNISIKNCPAFDQYSYKLALEAPINYYLFNDFVWIINVNTNKHFEYNNGKVVGIKVLDKLLKTQVQSGTTNKTAMIGKIIIDASCSVDEFAIYEKYVGQDKYPNVIIEYTDKVTKLEPLAVEIKFMGDKDQNATTFYRVLGKKGISKIGELITETGPTGIAITNPTKGDTSQYTYEFTGYWVDSLDVNPEDSSVVKYYVNGLNNPMVGAKNFNDVTVSENIIFYPWFKQDVKRHAVKFFDYNGNVILQNGKETFGVPYGMTYSDAKGPMTNFYYKDSSDLPAEKRYGFKGWSTSKFKVDEGKNIEFVDLEKDPIEKAINLYPYYETEDVHKVASNLEYFKIEDGIISLKDEYKATLQGKITIPSVNGVTTLGNFQKSNKITHIYFLDDSKITTLYISAFQDCEELQIVDLPNTVRTINGYAFARCYKLISVTLNNNITMIGNNAFNACKSLQINALPEKLSELGSAAFQGCENIKITTIPPKIKTLSSWTFQGCPNVKISNFGGANGESKLKVIESNCFHSAGNGSSDLNLEEIIFNYSIERIGVNAFYNYGTNTLKAVYFARPYEGSPAPYGTTPYNMGFTNPDLHIGQLENI